MSYSRKHLKDTTLNSYPIPDPGILLPIALSFEKLLGCETVARVTDLRGSNVCEVELPTKEKLLCTIPQKFRKLIWIKKGIVFSFILRITP
jgi:hypothetical protein